MSKKLPYSENTHFKRLISEIIFILTFGVFIFLVSKNLNLYEKLEEYLTIFEYLNLDELFFSGIFVLGIICFFGIRSYFEITKEFKKTIQIQKELEDVLFDKNKIEESLRLQETYSQEILSLVHKLEYSESYNEILSAVKKSISKVLGYRTVWFYKISEDKKYAELIFEGILPRSMRNQEFIQIEIDSSPYYKKITTKKEIDIVEDALNDKIFVNKKFIHDLQIHTLVHMPLLMHNESIGLLGTGSFGKQGVVIPTKEQLEFISRLSGYVALALNRIKLQHQQQEAKHALKKSEENYRLLIEQSAQAIYLQENGKYVIVNDNFLQIFGISRDEIENESFSMLNYAHPNSLALLQERKRRAALGEILPPSYEFTAITKDNREIELEASMSYVESDGKIKTQGILRDITSRKRTEKIQKAIFQISEASNSTNNLKELITKIHKILKSIMYAENFFVEFYDTQKELYHSAYFVDQYDVIDDPISALKGSLTDYIRRTEKATIIDEAKHAELVEQGEAKYILKPAKSWMGAPLRTPDGVIGVIALQNYDDPSQYTQEDLELLNLISGQIAIVLEKKKADEEVEKNSQFFKKVIDSLDNPLYVIDIESSSITIANIAAQERILHDKSIHRDCYGGIIEDGKKCSCMGRNCPITQLLENKKPVKFEQTYTSDSGIVSIYDVFAFPIIDSQGNVVQVIENLVDISDRKRFESKLSELAAFPEANPNIVMSINKDQEVIYMNSATSIVLGEIGVSSIQLMDCLPQNLDDLIANMLEDYNDIQDIRIFINGHTLAWSFHPVIGQDIIHCYGFDITNQVKQSDEIHKLSMVATQTSNMIMITDVNGIIEYVNPYFCKITGYEKSEVIGQKIDVFSKGKTSIENYKDIWITISSGQTWNGNTENKKKNGELYWESKTFSPIYNEEGDIISYISVGTDITNEIETQRQLVEAEKHSAIATLAAGVAHEFKNYLGGIIGNASFSLDIIDSDDGFDIAKETLQKIISMGEKANDVAMSLLTFSKAKPEDRNKEDLRKIILQSISLVEKELETLSIEVVTHFDDAPQVDVSLSKLQQLLLNLIINAKHAIGSNGVITVALFYKENVIEIRIGDSGGGIADEHLDKIFDPFYSTKGVWGKDDVSGTGMGLSICRNIAREHHGDLTVKSIVGVGSVFTITLPVSIEELSSHENLESSVEAEEKNVILFTFNQTLVSQYYQDACRAKLHLLLIDNFTNVETEIMNNTQFVVCDAKFSAKVELYRMIELCIQHNIPYVMVNCGTMEYQLSELYDGAVENYKEFPDFVRMKNDIDEVSSSSNEVIQ